MVPRARLSLTDGGKGCPDTDGSHAISNPIRRAVRPMTRCFQPLPSIREIPNGRGNGDGGAETGEETGTGAEAGTQLAGGACFARSDWAVFGRPSPPRAWAVRRSGRSAARPGSDRAGLGGSEPGRGVSSRFPGFSKNGRITSRLRASNESFLSLAIRMTEGARKTNHATSHGHRLPRPSGPSLRATQMHHGMNEGEGPRPANPMRKTARTNPIPPG